MSSEPIQPFLAGPFAVVRRPGEVLALDCETGQDIALRGALCAGDWTATLRGLGQLGAIRPDLERLHVALTTEQPEPLTYRTLLGRGGWEILFLELTGQCNERCRHCYAESSPERKEQLSWPEIEAVIHAAQTLGVRRLQLTGGDPLVSRHCLEAARLATRLGVPAVEIYTNGLALSESLADELCPLGVSFAMSFYSHRPEVHDQVTGTPGSQQRTLAAIERVVRRGNELRVSLISTAENREDLGAAVELLRSVGVGASQLKMDEEREVGRGRFEDASGRVPYALLPEAGPSTHGAAQGGGKLCVSYRGELFPCIFSRAERLGSIREASLISLLDTPLTARSATPRLELARPEARLTCADCRRSEWLLGRLAPS